MRMSAHRKHMRRRTLFPNLACPSRLYPTACCPPGQTGRQHTAPEAAATARPGRGYALHAASHAERQCTTPPALHHVTMWVAELHGTSLPPARPQAMLAVRGGHRAQRSRVLHGSQGSGERCRTVAVPKRSNEQEVSLQHEASRPNCPIQRDASFAAYWMVGLSHPRKLHRAAISRYLVLSSADLGSPLSPSPHAAAQRCASARPAESR